MGMSSGWKCNYPYCPLVNYILNILLFIIKGYWSACKKKSQRNLFHVKQTHEFYRRALTIPSFIFILHDTSKIYITADHSPFHCLLQFIRYEILNFYNIFIAHFFFLFFLLSTFSSLIMFIERGGKEMRWKS